MNADRATTADPDEASTNQLDPLVPRPIDLPTVLPAGGVIDPAVGDIAKIFAAPSDPALWAAWRRDLDVWRTEARARLNYSGAAYERVDSSWTQSCYSVALVWLWDERLFDHATQQFTVDAFLDSTRQYGGFDGIVLWHAYPIIGIDDRNQFDFYREVPGLRDVIAQLQDRGLKVFIDYNPWDTGTRRAQHDDAQELALIVGELGVDGVFLDTMKEGDSVLIDALQSARPQQVLEGESRVPNQRIEDHHLSWAQWFADSDAPGVLRAHWYERRHMLHSTRRWNRDHSDELQSAWMNGTGMLVWDAVFGVWVGWNERDTSTLRRMLRVQRALSDVLVNGVWSPLTDATSDALAAGVYASRFELDDLVFWTIVNRGTSDFAGVTLDTDATTGLALYDVTAGIEIIDGIVTVPTRGVTGIVGLRGERPARLDTLLAAAADRPSAASSFPARSADRVVPARSIGGPTDSVPTIVIAAGERMLRVTYRRRETGWYAGAPYVEEWKPLPPRLHDSRAEAVAVTVPAVRVGMREVTTGEFAHFLSETGYRPVCDGRFFRGPGADGEAPATLVSLDDARAYAAWVGGRLPTEFEWQVAASDPAFGRLTPAVWNWTESEHTDGITRFVMLKGGSDHESTGSDWYVDGGVRDPSFSLKLLLAGLGVERSTNIGFRVAWDEAAR